MFDQQWALRVPDAVGASEAWTQSFGDGVVVAVLDSGVQLDHPDLEANLWTNPGEIPGNNVDDDANGVIDDVHGANIVSGGGNVDDDEGHGTHVAGIVAARAGNGIGVVGVAPKARIMAVKVLDANRAGNASQLAQGIRYAVGEGARILNVSLNGDATNDELDSALRYAGQQGATIVASAGNNGRDLDARPSFPASSNDPAVVSVTASDQTGDLLGFANRGLNSVDIAAPGAEILSTATGSGYEFRAGTSMAAPYVAGTLALLAAARGDMSQADLRGALLSSARRLKGLAGLIATGQLNAGAAMHAVLPGRLWHTAPVAAAASAGPVATGIRLRLRTGLATRAGHRATLRWSASGTPTVSSWRVLFDGRRVATVGSDRPLVVRKRVTRAGTHRWMVVGYGAQGGRVAFATRSIKVLPRR
ncbi:MAG TPA: S8 family peptidase [Solirubrobacteraceae bacterium]